MLYSHLLNHTSSKILVWNDTKYLIQILKYHRLGYIIEVPFENCFTILMDHNTVSTPLTSLFLFYKWNGITILPADTYRLRDRASK